MANLFDDLDDDQEMDDELDGVDDSNESDNETEEDDDDDDDDEDEGLGAAEAPKAAPRAIQRQAPQGVFADRESVFEKAKRVDHRNPVVTRAEETANELLPARRPVSTKAQLVAVFDSQGRPFVAYHQNGRALEKFRMPTQQEFEILRMRGQIVKGGLGEATQSAAAAPGPQKAPEQPKDRTWLYVGAAAVGLGALAWWYNKKQKPARANRPSDDDDDGGED